MIICHFCRDAWDDVQVMSRHHLALALSKHAPNIFVTEPGHLKNAFKSIKAFFQPSKVEMPHPNLMVPTLSPWYGKVYSKGNLHKIQLYRRMKRLKKIIHPMGHPLVLYIWHPCFEPYLGFLDESLVVFHIHDEFLLYGAKETEKRETENIEKSLLTQSDVVVVNGPVLARRKNLARTWVNCPSAVSYNLFAGNEIDLNLKPSEFPTEGLIAGYYGTFNSKFDFEFLLAVAQKLNNVRIVLAGCLAVSKQDHTLWQRILNLDNVFYLGHRSLAEIARYTWHTDVGIMCYRNEGWARYGFPIKLFEFLAAGKPVVATPLESMLEYKDYIDLRGHPEEFAVAIENNCRQVSTREKSRRIELAKMNSWEVRAQTVFDAIQKKLEEKNKFT